jgi:hypothetical protein
VDRTSGAEVGGPYSNREDAQRAIAAGGFDQDAANLSITESSGNDDGGKEASLHTAAPVMPPVPVSTPGTGQPPMPNLGQPVPDHVFPQTTKPAQMPGGGGGGDASSLPQDPQSDQFDDQPMETEGPDPVASKVSALAVRVMQDNPDMAPDEARRVARKVVGRLMEAFGSGLMPNIQDPLADRNVLDLADQVKKTFPKKEPQRDPSAPMPDHPDDVEDDDSEGAPPGPRHPRAPRLPLGSPSAAPAAAEGGAAAEAGGLAAGAAELGELAPLLLL